MKKQNKLFIGRQKDLVFFREEVFFPNEGNYGSCIALCGPHGIGKTFILNQLMEEFASRAGKAEQKQAFCFYTSIQSIKSDDPLLDFKVQLLRKISKTVAISVLEKQLSRIEEGTEEYYIAIENLNNLRDAYETIQPQEIKRKDDSGYDGWRMEIIDCFEAEMPTSIFRIFSELGYRIVLIIDEFDRAGDAFPNGDIFQWLFSLTNKGGKGMDLNLSIVVVSNVDHHYLLAK